MPLKRGHFWASRTPFCNMTANGPFASISRKLALMIIYESGLSLIVVSLLNAGIQIGTQGEPDLPIRAHPYSRRDTHMNTLPVDRALSIYEPLPIVPRSRVLGSTRLMKIYIEEKTCID
jgi:hypothetical protein